jgi:hypothetical protein
VKLEQAGEEGGQERPEMGEDLAEVVAAAAEEGEDGIAAARGIQRDGRTSRERGSSAPWDDSIRAVAAELAVDGRAPEADLPCGGRRRQAGGDELQRGVCLVAVERLSAGMLSPCDGGAKSTTTPARCNRFTALPISLESAALCSRDARSARPCRRK